MIPYLQSHNIPKDNPHAIGRGGIPAGLLVDDATASPSPPPPDRLEHCLPGEQGLLFESELERFVRSLLI